MEQHHFSAGPLHVGRLLRPSRSLWAPILCTPALIALLGALHIAHEVLFVLTADSVECAELRTCLAQATAEPAVIHGCPEGIRHAHTRQPHLLSTVTGEQSYIPETMQLCSLRPHRGAASQLKPTSTQPASMAGTASFNMVATA
jgi:hypothetical protein